MQDLQGKPVIQKHMKQPINTGLFQEVVCSTDSTTIYDTIKGWVAKPLNAVVRKQHEMWE